MSFSTVNKYDLILHDVPTCAVCNKPVDSFLVWLKEQNT